MNTKLFFACVSILSSGILVGCGEGTTGAPTPATLDVTFSTPVNKATRVAIDQPLSITFADALDPTTVTANNFMLMPGDSGMADMADMDMDDMDHANMDMSMSDMSVIAGKVECNYAASPDCKTIKFTPSMSLAYGQKYHIMVHGLKTASGKTFRGEHAVPLEFTTAYVVETESERNIDTKFQQRDRYRKSTYSYTTDPFTGRPVRSQRVDTDSSGQSRTTSYNVPVGTSGRMGDIRYKQGFPATAENIERYTYQLKDGAGNTLASIVFDSPGADLQWGTTDDTIRSFSIRGEQHGGSHHLTTIYSTENGQSVVAPSPLSVNALKNNPGFTRVRGTLMFYDTTNGVRRMLKSVRFNSFGPNKTMDVTMAGTVPPNSDDVIDEYQVYIYDTVHTTSRLGRKEFELPDGGFGTLSLNELQDEQQGYLSGYRIYRTASTAAFGIAQGMLRVAEVTYRTAGNDQQWYNTSSNPNAEDDNVIRDIELNFYCPSNGQGLGGLYEKFEIEVDLNDTVGIGTSPNITTFLNTYENQLASANNCNAFAKPDQNTLANFGLSGAVLEDVDTNEIR